MTDPLKPGPQTTEFKTHLAVVVLAAVSAIGALVHPGFKVPGWVEGMLPIISLITLGVSQAVYANGRVSLKRASLVAVSHALDEHVPEILTALAASSRAGSLPAQPKGAAVMTDVSASAAAAGPTVESALADLDAAITALSSDVGSLKGQIAALAVPVPNDVTALVSAIEGRVAALTSLHGSVVAAVSV